MTFFRINAFVTQWSMHWRLRLQLVRPYTFTGLDLYSTELRADYVKRMLEVKNMICRPWIIYWLVTLFTGIEIPNFTRYYNHDKFFLRGLDIILRLLPITMLLFAIFVNFVTAIVFAVGISPEVHWEVTLLSALMTPFSSGHCCKMKHFLPLCSTPWSQQKACWVHSFWLTLALFSCPASWNHARWSGVSQNAWIPYQTFIWP